MPSCAAFMMADWAAMRQGAGHARMYRDPAAILAGSRRLFAVAGLRG